MREINELLLMKTNNLTLQRLDKTSQSTKLDNK